MSKLMSPRQYQLGKRQDQITESRERILEAARGLLAESTNYVEFTVDAVARRANVARATIYYQFESKNGLLEALCDALANEGGGIDLATAFSISDPVEATHAFITCFGRFWDTDRLVMRRLRALAALDVDVGNVITGRDDRRRAGVEVLVSRLIDQNLLEVDRDLASRTLFSLTSFENFDSMSLQGQTFERSAENIFDLIKVLWKSSRPVIH
jgi:AcrR family transcriptional regulator